MNTEMETLKGQLSFDYASAGLDLKEAELEETATAIHDYRLKALSNLHSAGEGLLRARQILSKHRSGTWERWLKERIGISKGSAWNYISAYQAGSHINGSRRERFTREALTALGSSLVQRDGSEDQAGLTAIKVCEDLASKNIAIGKKLASAAVKLAKSGVDHAQFVDRVEKGIGYEELLSAVKKGGPKDTTKDTARETVSNPSPKSPDSEAKPKTDFNSLYPCILVEFGDLKRINIRALAAPEAHLFVFGSWRELIDGSINACLERWGFKAVSMICLADKDAAKDFPANEDATFIVMAQRGFEGFNKIENQSRTLTSWREVYQFIPRASAMTPRVDIENQNENEGWLNISLEALTKGAQ